LRKNNPGLISKGGAMADFVLAPYCVYTIAQSQKLHVIFEKGGKGVLKEKKHWKTGLNLLEKARKENQILPIVFAAAESTVKLLYWGHLKELRIKQISEKDFETTYRFEHLKKISEGYSKMDLILRSSDKNISREYIRPYSICKTPTFL